MINSSSALGRYLRSSSVRTSILAWSLLWALNSAVVLVLYNFTVNALVGDLSRDIETRIDQRLEGWPKQLPAHAGVTGWLYRRLAVELAELEDCVALIDSDGELELANVDLEARAEFSYRRFYTVRYSGNRWRDQESAQRIRHCLVTDRVLTDGGRLTYGVPFDSYLETIRQLNELRFWGLLLTATLSAFIVFVLVSRMLGGLRAIYAACQRVAAGDLKQRIAPTGGNADIDHIARVINHMLDQIEQLMEGVRAVSDAIAHDLKTPLARLRGQLELLLSLPERNDDTIEAVIAEADQVLAAFNALLRIAQLEQGSPRRAFIHFDLMSLLQPLRDLFELPFADRDIAFTIEEPAQPCPVLGDRELWLQLLTNLLDNAYKYTPEGGSVTLALRNEGNQALLLVSDSGPGIPPRERANVTKRFYRLDKHRSSKGLGLGLSLVAAVCQAHHARLTLDSGEQGGLAVCISVPLDLEPA